MLRLRPIRYDGFDKNIYRSWEGGPTQVPGAEVYPGPLVHNFTYYDEFYDEISDGKVKPCSHTQIFFRPEVVTATQREPNHPNGVEFRVALDGFQVGLTPADIINSTVLPALPSPLLADQGVKALKRFLEVVDDSFSIINSIYELKDFEGMLKSVHKQALKLRTKIGDEGLKGLFKGLKPIPKWTSQPNGKVKKSYFNKPIIYGVEEVAHKANSANLQYQFAIAPLLSDIETLSQLGAVVEAAYDRLVKTNGVDKKLQYRVRNFCETATPAAFRKDYTWPSGGKMNIEFVLQEYGNTYVATQRRVRRYDLSNKQDALLRIALAMSGLNNPLQIIWNGIPMSFIVDFIFPMGNLISLGSIPPVVMTEDRSYDLTWSVSESWRFNCEFWSPFGISGERWWGGELKVRRYVRHVGPYVVALPLSTFTIKERMLVNSILGEHIQVYRNRHK